jgi:hypothetical protein
LAVVLADATDDEGAGMVDRLGEAVLALAVVVGNPAPAGSAVSLAGELADGARATSASAAGAAASARVTATGTPPSSTGRSWPGTMARAAIAKPTTPAVSTPAIADRMPS